MFLSTHTTMLNLNFLVIKMIAFNLIIYVIPYITNDMQITKKQAISTGRSYNAQ